MDVLLWLPLACGSVAEVATGDVPRAQLERLCEAAGAQVGTKEA